jgi:hypothetical protein
MEARPFKGISFSEEKTPKTRLTGRELHKLAALPPCAGSWAVRARSGVGGGEQSPRWRVPGDGSTPAGRARRHALLVLTNVSGRVPRLPQYG